MKLQLKQIFGLTEALKKPFSVSEVPPQEPIEGQVWFQPSTSAIFVYIQDTNGYVWVEAAK